MSDRDSEKKNKDPEKDKERKVVIEFDRGAKSAPGSGQAPSQDSSTFGPGDVLDLDDPTASPQVGGESLSAQLARVLNEKDELMQTLMRRQADFENYRKRIEREREEEQRRGVGRLQEELIPVLDALDRALKAHDDPAYEEYRKGLDLIYKQLWNSLSRNGLERITAVGATFDPHFHQAIERVETSEYPDGAIVEVFQDGYLFHGRVLRPSIVRVAVNNDGAAGDNESAARRRAN